MHLVIPIASWNKEVPLSDKRKIMKSGKRRSDKMKNDGPIDHAYKVYSLIIKNSRMKMTMRGNHRSEMSVRMY